MPKLTNHFEVPIISIPAPVLNGVLRDISKAHCSLGVLVELLRGNSQPDPASLAHLLEYIEGALENSDDIVSKYMSPLR